MSTRTSVSHFWLATIVAFFVVLAIVTRSSAVTNYLYNWWTVLGDGDLTSEGNLVRGHWRVRCPNNCEIYKILDPVDGGPAPRLTIFGKRAGRERPGEAVFSVYADGAVAGRLIALHLDGQEILFDEMPSQRLKIADNFVEQLRHGHELEMQWRNGAAPRTKQRIRLDGFADAVALAELYLDLRRDLDTEFGNVISRAATEHIYLEYAAALRSRMELLGTAENTNCPAERERMKRYYTFFLKRLQRELGEDFIRKLAAPSYVSSGQLSKIHCEEIESFFENLLIRFFESDPPNLD